MCFDVTSSFVAWGISTSAAWYLFERNRGYDRWNASFIACFSTIQILEAGIWWTKPSKEGSKVTPAGSNILMNEFLTKLIVLGLTSQPAVQAIAGYRYTHQPILWYLSWVFLGFFLYTLLKILKSNPGEYHSKVGEGGHLIWTPGMVSSFGVLYLIGLFVPLLFMKEGKGLTLLLIGASTAAYSLLIAKKNEFGSLWCFTAMFYSIAAVMM